MFPVRLTLAASAACLTLLLAGCGSTPLSDGEEAQRIAARIDAGNPEKQRQRFGILAAAIDQWYELPNYMGEPLLHHYRWRTLGVSLVEETWRRGVIWHVHTYEYDETRHVLKVFDGPSLLGDAFVLSDGTVFKPEDSVAALRLTLEGKDTIVSETGNRKLAFKRVPADMLQARLADQRSIGGRIAQQEQRQAAADRSEFWDNVMTGIQVVSQAASEVMAEQSAAQASQASTAAATAAANAARVAADSAARSRAEQQRRSQEAAQLTALNRQIAANQQAAQQLPAQQRAAYADSLARSKAASVRLAQAQQAAQTRAQAAEREAQRQNQVALAAQAQASTAAAAARAASAPAQASARKDETQSTPAAQHGGAGMPAPGQYQLDGGTYSVVVSDDNGNLLVEEPTGHKSSYAPQPDGSFHFRNPNNGVLYGMRSVEQGVIEAYKPERPEVQPTRLVLVGSVETAPEMDEKWVDLAEQYRARTRTDPANVQAWTACAAVAMKRAVGTRKDADRYAQQMATMLKQMDARSSPCTDVIPASMF